MLLCAGVDLSQNVVDRRNALRRPVAQYLVVEIGHSRAPTAPGTARSQRIVDIGGMAERVVNAIGFQTRFQRSDIELEMLLDWINVARS